MINRNGSTHQRQPDHDDPLADYPLLRAERDRKSGGDVTQKRSNTETQKPNSSEEEVIAPPGATGSRDPAPKHAPCVSALLCNTTMDEGRFLPAAFEAARNEPLPAAAK